MVANRVRLVAIVVAVAASAAAAPHLLHAQRGRQGNAAEKPKSEVVQTVGCAERKADKAETWWLARAADPRPAPPGIFSMPQIDAAKRLSAGEQRFELVGFADFLDPDALLQSGRRSEFTSRETANATGELHEGHKVLVKGMLIDAGNVKRINLLNVVSLGDSCG